MSAARANSAVAWLDYREEDAQRVRELLRAFEEKGTLDSIGVGAIRDTIADLLFPGLSTLHTRVRYFFFLPWLYTALEEDVARRPALRNRVPAAAREREVELMAALEAGGDGNEGVIGILRRHRVRVLPRDIYWGGLRRLGFLLFHGPSRVYLDGIARGSTRRLTYSHDPDIVAGSLGHHWHPAIPTAPDGFMEAVTFALTPEEATFMVERVSESAPESLLANLLRLRPAVGDVGEPWALADLAAVAPQPRSVLDHAEMFSHAMFGAQVLYNALLVDELRGDGRSLELGNGLRIDDQVAAARDAWFDLVEAQAARLVSWDREDFWGMLREANPRIPPQTRAFTERWINQVLADPVGAYRAPAMRRLVRERERSLKGPLARLSSQRAREVGEPPFGMEPLNYRWRGVARLMIEDVCAGLESGLSDA